jgi:hypothetical protein
MEDQWRQHGRDYGIWQRRDRLRGDWRRQEDGVTSASIVAPDPETLKVKDWFTQSGADSKSTPVVFSSKGKELLAEATSDGRLFLLDTGSLGGADHNTPLQVTPVSSGSRTSLVPDALATWGGRKGHPMAGGAVGTPSPPHGFKATNGTVANGTIVAWKMAVRPKASLEPAWVERHDCAIAADRRGWRPLCDSERRIPTGRFGYRQFRVNGRFVAGGSRRTRRDDWKRNLEQRQDDDLFRAWHRPIVKSRAGLSGDFGQCCICLRDAVGAAVTSMNGPSAVHHQYMADHHIG